jgi:hypothetical protein
MLDATSLFPAGCFGPDDEWLRERAVLLLNGVLARPSASFNALFDERRHRVGAYRLCVNPSLSLASLLEPAALQVGSLLARGDAGPDVLCVQDTTELDLTRLADSMSGLGEIGAPYHRGFFLHTALAVSEDGVPQGALDAVTWTRSPAEHGKAQRRKQRAFDDKESARWWTTALQAEARVNAPGRLVHVADREADIFDYLARCAASGMRVLVRATHDRRVDEAAGRLWAQAQTWRSVTTTEVLLPKRPAGSGPQARAEREERLAQVTVRFGPVTVKGPDATRKSRLPLWGVWVKEEQPPAGEEGLEWLLLTNDEITTAAQAVRRVRWYRLRWRVEELHKCLKSGCRAEHRQFESRETLERALTFFLLASVRLLGLRDLARSDPGAPAAALLDETEQQVLALHAKKTRQAWPPQPTVREAVRLLAGMGGFMGRKGDGEPGWLTLWRGFLIFQERVEGFRLALAFQQRGPPPAAPARSSVGRV